MGMTANVRHDEVLRRLREGDALRLDASYSYQSRFGDGTLVPHQVMQRLLDDAQVIKPQGRGELWRTT